MFLVFKQKTAYEMRISDWSSDVCSSDLDGRFRAGEIDGGPKPRSGVVQRQILIALLGLPRAGCARLDPNDEPSSAFRGYPHSCSSRRIQARSEERREGQEGVSTCESRWSTYH